MFKKHYGKFQKCGEKENTHVFITQLQQWLILLCIPSTFLICSFSFWSIVISDVVTTPQIFLYTSLTDEKHFFVLLYNHHAIVIPNRINSNSFNYI